MMHPPDYTNIAGDPLLIFGKVTVDVHRGHRGFYLDEPDERQVKHNLIVNTGRTFLARRIAGNADQTAPGSIMGWMAVGTGTTAPALTDGTTPGLYGEIKRLALSTNSALVNPGNVYTAVRTYGGASDSIQSIAITEAGVANHTGSGQGTTLQRVTFAAVTLADSDLLKITLETNVGSNTF